MLALGFEDIGHISMLHSLLKHLLIASTNI